MKNKTNEQVMRKLLKELNSIEVALLRERINTICDLTLMEIEKNPNSFHSPIFHVSQWESAMKHIKEIVKF